MCTVVAGDNVVDLHRKVRRYLLLHCGKFLAQKQQGGIYLMYLCRTLYGLRIQILTAHD